MVILNLVYQECTDSFMVKYDNFLHRNFLSLNILKAMLKNITTVIQFRVRGMLYYTLEYNYKTYSISLQHYTSFILISRLACISYV